jgi:serine palmitoyltransferase
MAYVNYALIIMLGHLRDVCAKLFQRSRYIESVPPEGYAPLFKSWENFYTRRLYHRIQVRMYLNIEYR